MNQVPYDTADNDFSDPSTWACTDGLGRELSTFENTGPKRENKYVGIFYWTWHLINSHRGTANITNVLKEHPGIEHDFNSPYWGKYPTYFWDEPLYGYYTKDKWVYRKHAELLAAAGVDVIFFDCTNGTRLFLDVLEVLAEAFLEARRDGIKAPCFTFLMPWGDEADAIDLREMYNKIYSVDKYRELWFFWKGKPLVLGTSGGLNENDEADRIIKQFFTFRSVQMSYFIQQSEERQWGWLAIYPQASYLIDGVKEEISVGTAQNYCRETGLTAMNGENVFGRTYTVKSGRDCSENAVLYGANLKEQFEYALEEDPELIFITGWNEWIAGRFDCWQGVVNAFPDEFSPEYSRDIEPSAGILKDHYYYQMTDYIRKFKGVNFINKVPACDGIDIYGSTEQWSQIKPYYKGYSSNSFNRDDVGFLDICYTNNTGRNIIKGSKVAHDNSYIYFMAETIDPISPCNDPMWMQLFISVKTGDAEMPNWETYTHVVNRVSPLNGRAVLEKSVGGWNWSSVGSTEFSVNGNILQIRIPKADLCVCDDDFEIRFKWSDNCQEKGDIMAFYQNGSTAPIGRFQYRYIACINKNL